MNFGKIAEIYKKHFGLQNFQGYCVLMLLLAQKENKNWGIVIFI